jgi:predicted nucleic acid-binding protein
MYLVDTNVISDAEKRVPEPTQWLSATDPDEIYLSVVTLGEIVRGIARVQTSASQKAARLNAWLADLRRNNAERILPVTDEIAIAWGRISAGRSRDSADGLIAATALVHDLIVVTRNVADFADTGVTVLDPWVG